MHSTLIHQAPQREAVDLNAYLLLGEGARGERKKILTRKTSSKDDVNAYTRGIGGRQKRIDQYVIVCFVCINDWHAIRSGPLIDGNEQLTLYGPVLLSRPRSVHHIGRGTAKEREDVNGDFKARHRQTEKATGETSVNGEAFPCTCQKDA